MPDQRQDILKYLGDTRSHYATYHNHKEVSAWAGVVLYVIFASQIAFARDEVLRNAAVLYVAWMLNGAFFLATLIYLHAQFRLRYDAANCVAALLYLSAEYLAMAELEVNKADWHIKASSGGVLHTPHVLPVWILQKSREFGEAGRVERRKLEAAAYVIVSATFLASVLRLWLHEA
jgi:hypothetical protein